MLESKQSISRNSTILFLSVSDIFLEEKGVFPLGFDLERDIYR